MNYIKKRIQSFYFAFSGIFNAIKYEHNLQVQFIIAICIIFAGIFFSITKTEWIIIFICISLVLCLEMINTAIENLCNLYSTENNPKIKYIKDVAAGAVLVAAIFSSIIGLLIFVPYLLSS